MTDDPRGPRPRGLPRERERRIYPVELPEPGFYDRRPAISREAALAVGVGAAALTALAAGYYYHRQGGTLPLLDREAPRPRDDAPLRVREDGNWNGPFAVSGKAVLIARPRAEVYAFWRDLSNQPRFMENVRAVRTDGDRSTWTFAGALGQEVEVPVEVTEERENELIAWSSVEGAPIRTRGSVEFRDAPAGRGTYVDLEVEYVPPAGAAGRAFAHLLRRSPQVQARHGLKRLRMLLETGEIATSARTKENA